MSTVFVAKTLKKLQKQEKCRNCGSNEKEDECVFGAFKCIWNVDKQKYSETGVKIRLAIAEELCYNQTRNLLIRRVGISVLQRLPKPVSDRNENLAFAVVSRYNGA